MPQRTEQPADRQALGRSQHPLKYLDFEGVIPKGEYGGGTMIVWDRGVWAPVHDPHKRAVERQLVLKELLAAEQLIAEAVRGRHFRGSRSLKQGAYALQ
jgi:ATP-dependent DNA ligase